MKSFTTVVPAMLLLLAVSACSRNTDALVIVDKQLMSEANNSSAGGLDGGMSVPSTSSIYWVSGSIKNTGTEEAKKVSISFRLTDGSGKLVVTAQIPSIPAGKTAEFRTPPKTAVLPLRLVDEDPDIRMEP